MAQVAQALAQVRHQTLSHRVPETHAVARMMAQMVYGVGARRGAVLRCPAAPLACGWACRSGC